MFILKFPWEGYQLQRSRRRKRSHDLLLCLREARTHVLLFHSFLLGSLQGRHVVGVLVADSFFLTATNWVYNWFSSDTPISIDSLDDTEVMINIHLPSSLPLELVVTMLELRQILRHPFTFVDEIEAITECFGFNAKITLLSFALKV